MPVIHLTSEHFRIAEIRTTGGSSAGVPLARAPPAGRVPTKKVLTLQIKDPVLLYLFSPSCGHCQTASPIINQISENVSLFRVCDLNVSANLNLYNVSKETTTPIFGVPMIIAYNNGRPISIFNGIRSYDNILGFLNNVKGILEREGKSTTIRFVNQNPSSNNIKQQQSNIGVPYNIMCDKGKCLSSI